MFTGIITDLGRVREVTEGAERRVSCETAFDTETMALGASIACSGVCLTVVDKGSGWFGADVSAETLSKTTLRDWGPGTPVNLERALRLGEELGGHLVSGHIDGVAVARERRNVGESLGLTFSVPGPLLPFIAAKGSIALDGVALTVNRVSPAPGSEDDGAGGGEDGTFEVNIVPHTAKTTTLGACRPGTRVNLEIDLIARYIHSLMTQA